MVCHCVLGARIVSVLEAHTRTRLDFPASDSRHAKVKESGVCCGLWPTSYGREPTADAQSVFIPLLIPNLGY